jgi:hypothetical protein
MIWIQVPYFLERDSDSLFIWILILFLSSLTFKIKKNVRFLFFCLLFTLVSLKGDVNVATVSNKGKFYEKCGFLPSWMLGHRASKWKVGSGSAISASASKWQAGSGSASGSASIWCGSATLYFTVVLFRILCRTRLRSASWRLISELQWKDFSYMIRALVCCLGSDVPKTRDRLPGVQVPLLLCCRRLLLFRYRTFLTIEMNISIEARALLSFHWLTLLSLQPA